MRISEECFELIFAAIEEGLHIGARDPKLFLTERDMHSWIFRSIVDELDISNERSPLGVHCQTRFLNAERELVVEPDIAIFHKEEYTVGSDGEVTPRPGYSYWGSSIIVQTKLCRTCRRSDVMAALHDIDKMQLIREIHYPDGGEFLYYPVYVYFSGPEIAPEDRQSIEEHAESKGVRLLIVSGGGLE